MAKKISELFDYGDGIAVEEQPELFAPETIKEMTLMKIHSEQNDRPVRRTGRRVSRTMLIAAAAACLLTVAALAEGVSIHRQRQEAIRAELKVDENNVRTYKEYDVSEAEEGVALLSAVRGGTFQYVYVDIAPVSAEEAASGEELFWFSVDGGDTWGAAEPYGGGPESCYDAQTRTLTLWCSIPGGDLRRGEPVELMLKAFRLPAADGETGEVPDEAEPELIHDYGSVVFYPTDTESRIVRFETPVAFENPQTGGTGRVLGVEIYPTGLTWLVEHDGAEDIYGGWTEERGDRDAWYAMMVSWVNAVDETMEGAVITFADGSVFTPGAGERGDYEDGIVRRYATFRRPIDINAAASVTINGRTVPLA